MYRQSFCVYYALYKKLLSCYNSEVNVSKF